MVKRKKRSYKRKKNMKHLKWMNGKIAIPALIASWISIFFSGWIVFDVPLDLMFIFKVTLTVIIIYISYKFILYVYKEVYK